MQKQRVRRSIQRSIQRMACRAVGCLMLSVMVGALFHCSGGAPPQLTPEQEDFYRIAHYLFTKNERKIFSSLPDKESRDQFIRNFWEIRDPNPYTPENEFKIEIESRYEFAVQYLKEGPVPGWKTDRGRIYIVLGPPSNRDEQYFPDNRRIIYWYYEELNIFVRFIDDSGMGIFRMDLTTVSLGLLDVLENKKHFIVNEEGKISMSPLKFTLAYDAAAAEIKMVVDTKNLSYEKVEEDGRIMAKIKVDLVVYGKDYKFFKHTDVRTVKIDEDKLLEKKDGLSLTVPLKLPRGKVRLDVIVTDMLGDASYRKFFKLEVKGN